MNQVDYFWEQYKNNQEAEVMVDRGYFRNDWVEPVSIEDLYQAFKSRLIAELRANKEGGLYVAPEAGDGLG